MEGTVNWFNIKKGYGFVKGEDGKDYFVHYSAVPQGIFLKEGDRISFQPAKTDKGEQAQDIQLLKDGESNHKEQPKKVEAEEEDYDDDYDDEDLDDEEE